MTRSWLLTAMAMLLLVRRSRRRSLHRIPDGRTTATMPAATRYSAARQIDRTNVAQLQVAWTYRTGAMRAADRADPQSGV